MSKFRIILFSLLGCLLIVMAVSMAGILPNRFFKWHEERQPSVDLAERDLFTEEGPTVDHVINNFYFPHYDAEGKEVFILKGKSAMLINNKVYKIERPEVYLKRGFRREPPAGEAEPAETVSSSSKTEGESNASQGVVITAKKGEINKDTKEALFTGGVQVVLGPGTTLKTDFFHYNPVENKAKTDRPVVLQGERMKIRGEGLEAELSTGRIWIEKEVVAELEGVKSGLLFAPGSDSAASAKTPSEDVKTVIRCDDKLVFEQETNMLTFHKRVKARKGGSTLMANKLVLVFDESARRAKMVIAEGNVLASGGSRVAKGSSLFWDAITDATSLEGTPSAEFFEERFTLIGPKIIFSQGGQKADTPRGGRLSTKGTQKTKEEKKAGQDWGSVNITWKGKMTFQKDQGQATFEDDVELVRKESTLYCQRMVIKFERETMGVKTMDATGGVSVVEKKGELLREASGQEGYWDFEKDVAEIRGEGTLFIQSEPGEEKGGLKVDWGQKMVVLDNKKKIAFYENVRAVKGPQKINSNQLYTFLGEASKLEKAVAIGDVLFVDSRDGGIEAIGDIMEWDGQSDKVVITGEPTAEVRRKQTRTFAKRVYYDLKTQQVGWKERPHWEIPMEKGSPTIVNPLLKTPLGF
jgi:lipopolysaccharide transport protein LptA